MSPYEIAYPGGSVEHWNEEAGQVWIQRMADTYRIDGVAQSGARAALELHAVDPAAAAASSSNRMFPLTLGGLDSAMKELNK